MNYEAMVGHMLYHDIAMDKYDEDCNDDANIIVVFVL